MVVMEIFRHVGALRASVVRFFPVKHALNCYIYVDSQLKGN